MHPPGAIRFHGRMDADLMRPDQDVDVRVTIGERFGLRPLAAMAKTIEFTVGDAVPPWIEPEVAGPIVDLRNAPSSSMEWGQVVRVEPDDVGPARIRGEMVWLKKDVSILCIEGHRGLTPEQFSENRRR